jgi:hypothetical protein
VRATPPPTYAVPWVVAGWSSQVARWAHNPEVAGSNPAPATKKPWSGAHLVQGCRRLTSGLSFGLASEGRVSRVDFSGPAHDCVRMLVQGVRGERWPSSCGFVTAGASGPPVPVLLRGHAQGMRTHCPDQRYLKGTGVKSGPRGVRAASFWSHALMRRQLIVAARYLRLCNQAAPAHPAPLAPSAEDR